MSTDHNNQARTPRKSRRLTKKATVLAAGSISAVGLLAGGGSAVALAADSSPNVYQGCLGGVGVPYNVHLNPSAAPTCWKGDKQITWNQTGPAGATGPQGAKGDTGPQGPAAPSPEATTVTKTLYFRTTPEGTGSGVTALAAVCPNGYIATGGGYLLQNNVGGRVNPAGEKAQNLEVLGQFPATGPNTSGGYDPAQPGSPANAWATMVSYNDSTGSITVYAECYGRGRKGLSS